MSKILRMIQFIKFISQSFPQALEEMAPIQEDLYILDKLKLLLLLYFRLY